MGLPISFCVPLIIIGFIAPPINRLQSNASRMPGLALVCTSSVCAALLAMAAGCAIIPGLSIRSVADGLRDLPALVFSVLVGPAAIWTRARIIIQVLEAFQQIAPAVVTRIGSPILPFFIAGTFCTPAYGGSITRQLPVFLIVILIVLLGHCIWLTVLYGLACLPWKPCPPQPPWQLCCGAQNVHPSCARTWWIPPLRQHPPVRLHTDGSVLCHDRLQGALRTDSPPGAMVLFCFLLGILAAGTPGIPGGTVMASLVLTVSAVGFDDTGAGLMLAIFALQDSFGTACNVTGDGALALILTGYAKNTTSPRFPGRTCCRQPPASVLPALSGTERGPLMGRKRPADGAIPPAGL